MPLAIENVSYYWHPGRAGAGRGRVSRERLRGSRLRAAPRREQRVRQLPELRPRRRRVDARGAARVASCRSTWPATSGSPRTSRGLGDAVEPRTPGRPDRRHARRARARSRARAARAGPAPHRARSRRARAGPERPEPRRAPRRGRPHPRPLGSRGGHGGSGREEIAQEGGKTGRRRESFLQNSRLPAFPSSCSVSLSLLCAEEDAALAEVGEEPRDVRGDGAGRRAVLGASSFDRDAERLAATRRSTMDAARGVSSSHRTACPASRYASRRTSRRAGSLDRVFVAGQLVDSPGVPHQARRLVEGHRPIERHVAAAATDVVARRLRCRHGEARELVRGEVREVARHLCVGSPARLGPREELLRDVAKVVRARTDLGEERAPCRRRTDRRTRRSFVPASAGSIRATTAASPLRTKRPIDREPRRRRQDGLDVLDRDAVRLEEAPQVAGHGVAGVLAQAGVGDRALERRRRRLRRFPPA